MNDKLLAKIEALKQQREEVVKRANEQITAISGAIAVCEELLHELDQTLCRNSKMDSGSVEERQSAASNVGNETDPGTGDN